MGLLDILLGERETGSNQKSVKPYGSHHSSYCERVGANCSKVLGYQADGVENRVKQVYCKLINDNCTISI